MAKSSLLQVMASITHVDASVYIKSMHTEEVWNDLTTFPSGNKFNKEFKIRQEMTEEGYFTMIMYAKIIHRKARKEIKDSKAVMSYLRQNHVFMFIDQFNTKK
eukprot:9637112-Ditylum_brightwellii.AAC.1